MNEPAPVSEKPGSGWGSDSGLKPTGQRHEVADDEEVDRRERARLLLAVRP